MAVHHGVVVTEKATGKIIDFVKCDYGQEALRTLSGIRINLNHEEYKAQEAILTQEQFDLFLRQ